MLHNSIYMSAEVNFSYQFLSYLCGALSPHISF
jgi:hypothetical protein